MFNLEYKDPYDILFYDFDSPGCPHKRYFKRKNNQR